MTADDFKGDTPHLIRCIKALLSLDADGALTPHRLPGHARTLLSAAAARLGCEPGAQQLWWVVVNDQGSPDFITLTASMAHDHIKDLQDRFLDDAEHLAAISRYTVRPVALAGAAS